MGARNTANPDSLHDYRAQSRHYQDPPALSGPPRGVVTASDAPPDPVQSIQVGAARPKRDAWALAFQLADLLRMYRLTGIAAVRVTQIPADPDYGVHLVGPVAEIRWRLEQFPRALAIIRTMDREAWWQPGAGGR